MKTNSTKKVYFILRTALLRILFKHKSPDNRARKTIVSILIIRLDRIGDMVVSTPAIKVLKQLFPQSKISILLRPKIASLAKLIPEIEEVIIYRGFCSCLGILKQRQFSLAVDLLMDYSIKTALLANFSGAKIKAGFDLEGRGLLFDISLRPSDEQKEISKHLLDLIGAVATETGSKVEKILDPFPHLIVSTSQQSFAQDFLNKQGIGQQELVLGIAPGAKFPSQCWPIENFAKLADKISNKYKAKIIIIGSVQEGHLIKRFFSLAKTTPIQVVEFPLDKLAAVISKTHLLICNNSGILHIASALGIPTVSTMGPTEPYLWWPQGRDDIVIRKDLACSPCNRSFCSRHDCMRLITIEEMLKAVDIQMEKINFKIG